MEDRVIEDRVVEERTYQQAQELLAFHYDLAVIEYQRLYAMALMRGSWSLAVERVVEKMAAMFLARHPYYGGTETSRKEGAAAFALRLTEYRHEVLRVVLGHELRWAADAEEERRLRSGLSS